MLKNKSFMMLITGVALAIVLWGIAQIVQNNAVQKRPDEQAVGSEQREPLSGQYTNAPASILSAFQNEAILSLKGIGVPGAGISLHSGGSELTRTKISGDGYWAMDFLHDPVSKPIAIDILMITPDGHRIRSDQSLYVIHNPHPTNVHAENASVDKALLLLTAPGANSRVLQTSYKGLPGQDGFFIEAIDYDNSGGVIFSGRSERSGKVRIYAGDNLVGESHVDNLGRWSLIFGNIMPLGQYTISAELVADGDKILRLTLPFERMQPLFEVEGSPKIKVEHLDDRIQIGRALFGGGYQYTVVYAPVALEE